MRACLASPPEDFFYGNDDGANTAIAQAFRASLFAMTVGFRAALHPRNRPLASIKGLP
jgi:hypothetical protein